MRFGMLVPLIAIGASGEAAEVAGPPAPAASNVTAAARAAVGYRRAVGARVAARPCRQGSSDEIVVCAERAGEISPYRLPLPDERGPSDAARRATGGVPTASLDTSTRPPPEPSRLLETIGKLVRAAKGEDPD